MVNCKLDLNAIMADNGDGGSPALLFVNLFYHQRFVTGVTKTSKTGLPLFLSAKGYFGISKSETDPGTDFPISQNIPRPDTKPPQLVLLRGSGYF